MNRTQGRDLTIHCIGPIAVPHPLAGSELLDADEVVIHMATIEELRPRADAYAQLLDRAETERMQRFKFDVDRERFLLGHGFARSVLGARLDMPPSAIRYLRGPYGKPYLAQHPLHFNLSDTKDAVAIAVHSSSALGVDIESMARGVDHEAVGTHYFRPEEQRSIAEAVDGKRRFLEFWTRKEAVLKASGVGIMDDLRVLRVDQPVNHLSITHDAFISLAAPNYHVATWHIGETHIVSLATSQPCTKIRFVGV